ncbi:PGF-pre-PGF domain-containing protein [Methanolobus zinderi]|uniref:PGF-pre-PGF domain-containing protein n=1 Tax=Methanolobus zinderi TaxID=536044 RepID=A0A7D5E840_9EURY|nr:S8 family serine peptidase [Methanolobus zinderi]QLC49417.1 PGF-pre-PGF domain-containing protein [Methanolobus zinderi]
MHTKNTILVAIILILLPTTLAVSGSTDNTDLNDNNLILLKAAHINTDTSGEEELQTEEKTTSKYSIQSAEDVDRYYIVQFTGPARETWRQNITARGATIYNYVPNNAFIFKMSTDVKANVESLDFVKWVGEYQPSYKYESELTGEEGILTSKADTDTEETYHVILFSESDYKRIISNIENLGVRILSGSGNVLRVETSADKIPEIASISGVSWIEEYVLPTINNDVAAGIITVDTVRNTYGLNGSGQIVAVCDTGLDTGNKETVNDDFRGRVIDIFDVADDGDKRDLYSGHGTHVAGSVLGNGNLSNGLYAGMAPEAKLVFQAIGEYSHEKEKEVLDLPANLKDVFFQAYNTDTSTRIHTNSWGGDSSGEYTTESQQVDSFVWEHPDMLIVFAAGNEGPNSNTIGYPATAKNALTVGASENDRPEEGHYSDNVNDVASFSSRGPTADGRIKPDVVAPGTFIASTRSSEATTDTIHGKAINSNYLYLSGTSMSTPIVAGSAALIRQYYTDIDNVSNPSAALIKATLINGACDINPESTGRPDYSQGWGRVDIENSIYPQYPYVIEYFDNPEALNDDQDNVSYNPEWNISYNVAENSDNLRATLVWTDYPGFDAADNVLVNNLDMILVTPDNSEKYGNLGSVPDTLNNVEGIELQDPAPGTYNIIVNATAIQKGPQNFSLVLYYKADVNEYPKNNNYTTNGLTPVSINLTHAHGINPDSINMTINGLCVNSTPYPIDGGFNVSNQTAEPYQEGYYNVSITALTNQSEEISYEWTFYVSVEDNVITIDDIAESSVIQENTVNINISDSKYCNFWYNVDNGENSSTETGFWFNTTLNLTEGQHNFTVFAEDITGFVNSTTVNFTVFNSQPTIDSPESGTIYYLPADNFSLNGTAGIATNISVYVNGIITNESWPVSNGMFNLTNIPLSNGTNTINVTSIYNNSENNYFSSNTTIYLSLGETFNTEGNDEAILSVPGISNNVSHSVLNFNITGTSANPGNISAAIVRGEEPVDGSILAASPIDIRVINESDVNYSYQFGRNVSLTLGYDTYLVTNAEKLMLAWYNPEEDAWISFRTSRNTSAHTVTANITHLSIYAPLEDNTAPVISDLTYSSTRSSVTLTWNQSQDTDHVEIWKNGVFLKNSSAGQTTDTGLSEATDYDYGLRAIDFAGNTGNWSNISATTAAVITTTSSSSGGGGGGGGGGSTGEKYENIVFKDVLTLYAGKDEVVDFDFNDDKNDIDYVRYLSLKNAGKITVTIEVLKNTSTFSNSVASGTVYKNINIWVGKTGYATEENIRDPVIGFRVDREWLLENDIDQSSLELQRYSGGVWNKLSTELCGSDEEYLYFEAKTPGFSPFAITGMSTEIQTENIVDGTVLMEEEIETNEDPLAENTSRSGTESSTSYAMLWVYAGFAGLILAIAYLLVRKQQN